MNALAEDAVTEGIAQQVTNGWNRFMENLPEIAVRLITAAALIVAGLLILRLGRRLIRKAFQRNGKTQTGKGTHQRKTLQTLITSVFNYILYFAIAMSALSTLGVDVSSMLAVAGVGSVAIGFGCQTLVKDFISGMFLWTEGWLQVGEVVTVGEQTGTVESIALRTTVLRSANGCVYVVPNGDIRTVVNMSRDYRNAHADILLPHGLPYGEVIACLQEEMEKLYQRLDALKAPPQVLGIIGMDRFAVTIRIECRCAVDAVWALEREMRLAAMERMTKEGYHL